MTPIALTIAGSDPSGGAGVQADLKTFHQHQVYGMAVITLLTVQSTRGVARVEALGGDLLAQQLDFLLADITPGAAKTGALGSAALVEVVAERAKAFRFPLVVDPVMISKHGHPLIDAAAVDALKAKLLPATFLLTPNAHEAAALTGRPVTTLLEAADAAKALAQQGPRHVLVKGGHLQPAGTDLLFSDGVLHHIEGEHLDTPHTHGTGCSSSAAITAWLSRGVGVVEAVTRARRWLTAAIRTGPRVGNGIGPVNHLAPVV